MKHRLFITRVCPAALCAVLMLLAGCAALPPQQSKAGVSVTVSNFPLYSFARAIAGDAVDVTLLLHPGSESHTYEPTPRDILRIRESAVLLCIGGPSESWIDRIMDGLGASGPRVIALLDHVNTLEEETPEGMQARHEHDEHGEHGEHDEHEHTHDFESDEHIWTSPKNAMQMTQTICDALCEAAPAYSEVFRANAVAYSKELQELDDAFQAVVAAAPTKTMVFGDRFPFLYFAREYGLTYFAAFPGCAEESEPSAATVKFLIDKVREEHIPAVLHLELSNEAMANTICEATGAKKLLLHSCHNVSKAEFESGVTYLSLMWQNVSTLKEALSCP